MGRALWPALKARDDSRSITMLVFLSTVAIGLFYGAGLMWGRNTHLSMVEYWRWWVVHLWVEGFFEVFATAVIAFLFTKLGLVRVKTATNAVLFATVVFLTGGVLGTFHHLYWTGTPTGVLAIGSVFSALEVVPLVLVGFEAYENYKHSFAKPWVAAYRWPILFFVAVAFWNLVGAGLFGFLINPPLALYYMQGLNTTPLHGHTALFGVYGMLGIGLMLFCLRGLGNLEQWDERLLKGAFWSLNLGLAAMALLSLFPYGVDAGVCGRVPRLLVRALGGVPAAAADAAAGLAAHAGRHPLQRRRADAGRVRRQAVPRARPAPGGARFRTRRNRQAARPAERQPRTAAGAARRPLLLTAPDGGGHRYTGARMATTPSRPSHWAALTAAPHRTLFFCGTLNLLIASGWWLAHLVARYTGFPTVRAGSRDRADLGPLVPGPLHGAAHLHLRFPVHDVSAVDERTRGSAPRLHRHCGAAGCRHDGLDRRVCTAAWRCSLPAPRWRSRHSS